MKYKPKFPLASATAWQDIDRYETLSETSRITGVSIDELTNAIDHDFIAWKKSGGVYILDMTTVNAWLARKYPKVLGLSN